MTAYEIGYAIGGMVKASEDLAGSDTTTHITDYLGIDPDPNSYSRQVIKGTVKNMRDTVRGPLRSVYSGVKSIPKGVGKLQQGVGNMFSSMFKKSAIDSDAAMGGMMALIPSVWLSSVVSKILGDYATSKLTRSAASLPRISKREINKILRDAGAGNNYLSLPFYSEENAAYVPTSSTLGVLHGANQGYHGIEALENVRNLFDANGELRPDVRKRIEENKGSIMYHPAMARANIIAHEAGHASIAKEPWHSSNRLKQDILRDLSPIGMALSPLAGYAATAFTKNPYIGMAVGGGLGALSAYPTLSNEAEASRRAGKSIDAMNMSAEEKKKQKDTLRSALNTYRSSLIPAALAGIAPGALSLWLSKSRSK